MSLRIGQLAEAASVNVQTVRYYERRGLLRPKRRTVAGYREYDVDAVRRLRFIKHAQLLGFSLNDIDELLALRVRHGGACATIERKTRRKIALIEEKIRELGRLQASLEGLACACETRKPTADCPVLEVLGEIDLSDADGAKHRTTMTGYTSGVLFDSVSHRTAAAGRRT